MTVAAAHGQRHLDPAVIARLGSLELKARAIVEGFISGLHRSPFRGFSVEFAEYRPYLPGDDLASLDWKVYARSDRHFVKKYEEETNLRATIVLDVSKRFKDLLDADSADTAGGGKWTALMTRTGDTFPSLAARSAYSNNQGADRFMSIHANAFGDPSANGICSSSSTRTVAVPGVPPNAPAQPLDPP